MGKGRYLPLSHEELTKDGQGEHGETGFLAPADDADTFAAHIAALAKDPALRRRMGEAARARALTFSWEETMARMLGYYRALPGA